MLSSSHLNTIMLLHWMLIVHL
ncbi:hypothetical protein Patl1_14149 [Pistacia atlantica]|uniref:Uncharacterized protein n=1 Tax=Pistacia atlantica TaxID=434234 RepID=A0ACC1AUL9_9ROSI|nr:hypothetical protein Patl1_14149 [Pistacia atlantica]